MQGIAALLEANETLLSYVGFSSLYGLPCIIEALRMMMQAGVGGFWKIDKIHSLSSSNTSNNHQSRKEIMRYTTYSLKTPNLISCHPHRPPLVQISSLWKHKWRIRNPNNGSSIIQCRAMHSSSAWRKWNPSRLYCFRFWSPYGFSWNIEALRMMR